MQIRLFRMQRVQIHPGTVRVTKRFKWMKHSEFLCRPSIEEMFFPFSAQCQTLNADGACCCGAVLPDFKYFVM